MDKHETFGRRVGAAIIDSMIALPVNWGIAFTVMMVFPPPNQSMLAWALPGFVTACYYILMHFRWGQTIGKMAVGVKVLTDSETPISFGQAIARSLPQLLVPMFAVSFSTARGANAEMIGEAVGVIYGFTFVFSVLNVVVALASVKRRAVHDFIAGTIVVRTGV